MVQRDGVYCACMMLRRSRVPGPLPTQTMVCLSTLITQSDDEKSKPSGAPEVSWLLRTSYLTSGHQSADRPAAKAASDKLAAAAAPAEDIASRVAAIEDTFQAAAQPPRHATNPELTAEEVLPSTSCLGCGRCLDGWILKWLGLVAIPKACASRRATLVLWHLHASTTKTVRLTPTSPLPSPPRSLPGRGARGPELCAGAV